MSKLTLAASNGLPTWHGISVETHAFYLRLHESSGRLIFSLLFGIIALAITYSFNKKLAIGVSLIGGFFIGWSISNMFTRSHTPLFVGAQSPSQLWQYFYSGWGPYGIASFLASVVAIIIGIVVFIDTKTSSGRKELIGRSIAGISTWGGIMLLYSLIVIQLQVPHILHQTYLNWNHTA
jgi:hypothetical protein